MRHPPPRLNYNDPPLDRVMASIIGARVAATRDKIIAGLPGVAGRLAAAQARLRALGDPAATAEMLDLDAAPGLDFAALTSLDSRARALAADLEDRADDLEDAAERRRLASRSEIDRLRDEVARLRARLDPPPAVPSRPSPLQLREQRRLAPPLLGGYRGIRYL